jgi:hypothetical protein
MTATSFPAIVLHVNLVEAALRSEELGATPRLEIEERVRDYTRFLTLCRLYPDRALAPTKRIDPIWHLHMQHPRAYVADCYALFGDILDHDGGFGSTPDEARVLQGVFADTATLWEKHFGVAYVGEARACTRNCVSRCKRACKTRVEQAGSATV